MDFFSLGWKAAAVNLSDIAAMGGIPRYCLTALGIPAGISVEQVAEFYRGFNALLKNYATALVGGDTCSSRKGLFISVTALGEVEPKRIITRTGAEPGDRIFVTGTLGDSAAGLELLRIRNVPCIRASTVLRPIVVPSRGESRDGNQGPHKRRAQAECGMRNKRSTTRNPQSAIEKLIAHHLRPVPRVEWGRKLALSGCASAMIDLSDGLSSDLFHICEQSGVGA